MTETTTSPAKQSTFVENSYQERLIRLRAENPKAFAVLSPSEKIALSIYEDMKRRSLEPQTPTDAHKSAPHEATD
jgi:hypothetical protein